jgi:hypothetical protein
MADHLQQLNDLSAEHLEPGESILGIVKVVYGGKVNFNQPPKGLAALGQDTVTAGEELAARHAESPTSEFPTANQMALVLTNGRLLVWSTSGFKAKPKAFLGAVPLNEIEAIQLGESRLNVQYTIKMNSGWSIAVDADRGEAASDFGAHLSELVAQNASDGEGSAF